MEELLTVQEVAERLRVDDTTLRRWIAAGLIDAVILPHTDKRKVYRIRQSELERILNPGKPQEKRG